VGGAAVNVRQFAAYLATLDPATQPFLNDHRIDGTPVLPGVMGLEGFAEVARLLAPGWHVAGVEDADFRAPVKFYRDEPRQLTITALVGPDGADLVADCRLEAERVLPGSDSPQRTVHFSGRVRLVRQAPEPETAEVPAQEGPEVSKEDVYRLYFHGPAYQVIASAWKHGDGTAARFAADLPANHEPAAEPTTLGPRLVELCFQTAGLWEAGVHGRLALPLHVGRVRLLAEPVESGSLVAVTRPAGDAFDCEVIDGDGRVILRLDGYGTVPLPEPVSEDVRTPFRSVLDH